jgi:hypothetical protein
LQSKLVGLYIYWDFFGSMVELVASPIRKITTLMCVVSIINVHQWMLGGCFEGYIVNWYGSSHVIGNELKFINCDFTYSSSNMIVTLNKGSPKLLLHSPIVWMLDCTYIGLKNLCYIHKQVRKNGLVFCFERWGQHYHWTYRPISSFLMFCCSLIHWGFYLETRFERTWNNKFGCYWNLWQAY